MNGELEIIGNSVFVNSSFPLERWKYELPIQDYVLYLFDIDNKRFADSIHNNKSKEYNGYLKVKEGDLYHGFK